MSGRRGPRKRIPNTDTGTDTDSKHRRRHRYGHIHAHEKKRVKANADNNKGANWDVIVMPGRMPNKERDNQIKKK